MGFNSNIYSPLNQFQLQYNAFVFFFSITLLNNLLFVYYLNLFSINFKFLIKKDFFNNIIIYLLLLNNNKFTQLQDKLYIFLNVILLLGFFNLLSIFNNIVVFITYPIIIYFLSTILIIPIFLVVLTKKNIKIFKNFIQANTHKFITFFLIPLEIFSYIMRVISLATRILANVIAGHILLHIIIYFCMYLLSIETFYNIVIILITMLLLIIQLLEILIAVLQIYVFVLLIILYYEELY